MAKQYFSASNDSRIRDLDGSTNCEQRFPSRILHLHLQLVCTSSTVVISGLHVPIRSLLLYVIPCMCGDISCLLIFALNMHVKIFNSFEV